ncbi:MAG: putative Ig domain-containing protein, partial [Candidatus Competibacteraceae bacterium]|nr:putative Ig domain-containing protein [Candidatus Competibacteraceae bacterium]
EFQALCSGGECPANSVYEWSLISGSLPSGVTLTGSGRTGVLSGTPTQSGALPVHRASPGARECCHNNQ